MFIRRADEPGLEDVERAIRRAGLQVAIVAAVSAFVDEGLFLSSPDPSIRGAMIARMRLQIEFAARLGAFVPIGLLRGKQGGEERLVIEFLGKNRASIKDIHLAAPFSPENVPE